MIDWKHLREEQSVVEPWRNLCERGAQMHVKKLWKTFFIKRFTLTIEPMLIALLKPISAKFEMNNWVGQVAPEKIGGAYRPVRPCLLRFCPIGNKFKPFFFCDLHSSCLVLYMTGASTFFAFVFSVRHSNFLQCQWLRNFLQVFKTLNFVIKLFILKSDGAHTVEKKCSGDWKEDAVVWLMYIIRQIWF